MFGNRLVPKAFWQYSLRKIVLHEYQSAHILHQYNIPLPRGNVAFNHKEAVYIARKFGLDYDGGFVIKAQVQCPTRRVGLFKKSGLRGGVHFVETVDEVQELAEQMCGQHMSFANDSHGTICQAILIYELLQAEHEIFLSIDYDTAV